MTPSEWKKRAAPVLGTLAPFRWRAHERALLAKHRDVDVPHLVRALLDDARVQEAVRACSAELEDVTALTDGTLDEQPKKRFWHIGAPRESDAFEAVCQQAVIHAVSAELEGVSPVGVLARALAVAPESALSGRLDAFEVEPLRLMRYDAHAVVEDRPFGEGRGPARVVLLNDPYTTMEFVVDVLQRWLDLDPDAAMRCMRNVHQGGRDGVVFRTWDEARRRAEAARQDARERGFPLELTLEPA